MNNSIFGDIILCVEPRTNRLSETYITSVFKNVNTWQARTNMEQEAKRVRLASRISTVSRLVYSSNLRKHVSPKRQLNFSGLHCVISQKIEVLGVYSCLEQWRDCRRGSAFVSRTAVQQETCKEGILTRENSLETS
jgi:hypothetical protein